MRLERALGAFDMFMLHDNEGDLDEVRALHLTCPAVNEGRRQLRHEQQIPANSLIAGRSANYSTTLPPGFTLQARA